ncbi:MAG: TrkA C-terminal domain-containing protein, partial [Actinomycetota bacterium]|nr:TrkA C-terminal domain-containing protein [Actinomycetota bacterium]
GAVPIVFAAIPLGLSVSGSEEVFDETLLVVLALLVLQTPFLPLIARRLGLSLPDEAAELEVENAPLDAMNAVVLAMDIQSESGLVGIFVSELGLPHGAVVSLVVRDGEPIPIDAHSRLRSHDRILVVCPGSARITTEERLRILSKDGRLATWVRDPIEVRAHPVKQSWPRLLIKKIEASVSRDQ